MSSYQKTAKDRAFERERQKFQGQIKRLKSNIDDLQAENRGLQAVIAEYQKDVDKKDNEIAILKAMVQMSPEQLAEHFENIKKAAKAAQHFDIIRHLIKISGGDYL